jgi:hypothetical protein
LPKYEKKTTFTLNRIKKSTFFCILDWIDDWTFNQIQLQKSKKFDVQFTFNVKNPKK